MVPPQNSGRIRKARTSARSCPRSPDPSPSTKLKCRTRGRDVHGVNDCRRIRRVVIMDLDPRGHGDVDNVADSRFCHFCPEIKEMTLDSKTTLLQKGNICCAVAVGLNIQFARAPGSHSLAPSRRCPFFSYVSFRIWRYIFHVFYRRLGAAATGVNATGSGRGCRRRW